MMPLKLVVPFTVSTEPLVISIFSKSIFSKLLMLPTSPLQFSSINLLPVVTSILCELLLTVLPPYISAFSTIVLPISLTVLPVAEILSKLI